MQGMNRPEKRERLILLTASAVMLLIAFIQCFRTVHDLTWPFDTDFDRDMSFIHNALAGHSGQDPTYAGHYLWYNPLLFSIEALLVRITGLPINIIVARAGLYLNLLGPLSFFLMAWRLFDLRVATTALLSYLFLASGKFEGTGAATYSPWLYPVTFAQFFFYVNILLSFKAFSTQRYGWFILLGVSIGLCFLAHAAPALLSILILLSMQAGNFGRAWREKNYPAFGRLFGQGLAVLIPFLLVAAPFLFFIVGKYHLHMVNRYAAEWRPPSMMWNNWQVLLKKNLSFSLPIAIIGFIWFYRNVRTRLPRLLILNWLIISVIMYVYSASVTGIRDKFHLQLPATVPCYHYFFYLKALQSLLFWFGLLWLLDLVFRFIKIPVSATCIAIAVLVFTLAYFPVYKDRVDFSVRRSLSLAKAADTNRVAAYDYLVAHIPADKVILCPEPHSTFPTMASGRKMVCVSVLFSNPYLSFDQRYIDDSLMLAYLKTGVPASAHRLFEEYDVSYLLLPTDEFRKYPGGSPLLGPVLLQNDSLTLLRINR